MIDFTAVPILWKSNKKELLVWFTTFILVLVFGTARGVGIAFRKNKKKKKL